MICKICSKEWHHCSSCDFDVATSYKICDSCWNLYLKEVYTKTDRLIEELEMKRDEQIQYVIKFVKENR